MDDGRPLSGRVCLVTGASGGIGAAVARRLADAGADLALAYRSHRADAEAVAQEISAAGRRVVVLQADLSERQAPQTLVAAAQERLGAVDLLVANAGHGQRRSYDAVTADDWDETLAVNLRAPFLLAQAVLPGMRERRWGRVLFVSSVAAFTGGVVGPDYAASKAGLHGLTYHLASRVAPDGVTVNAIAPALVAGTRMLPGDEEQLVSSVPVGRLGTTAETADLSLAMVTNGYLTGKVFGLDGGLYPR